MISIYFIFFLNKKGKNALKITTKMTKLRFVINICDLGSLKKDTHTRTFIMSIIVKLMTQYIVLKMKSVIEIFTNF